MMLPPLATVWKEETQVKNEAARNPNPIEVLSPLVHLTLNSRVRAIKRAEGSLRLQNSSPVLAVMAYLAYSFGGNRVI